MLVEQQLNWKCKKRTANLEYRSLITKKLLSLTKKLLGLRPCCLKSKNGRKESFQIPQKRMFGKNDQSPKHDSIWFQKFSNLKLQACHNHQHAIFPALVSWCSIVPDSLTDEKTKKEEFHLPGTMMLSIADYRRPMRIMQLKCSSEITNSREKRTKSKENSKVEEE